MNCDQSTLVKNSLVPLIELKPSDLGSLILTWIFPEEYTQLSQERTDHKSTYPWLRLFFKLVSSALDIVDRGEGGKLCNELASLPGGEEILPVALSYDGGRRSICLVECVLTEGNSTFVRQKAR